jgi:hypothetical protein
LFRVGGKLDRFDRIIGACAGDHGDAPLRGFNRQFNDLLMFFMRQRGTLTRGAARHEAIGTLVDLPLDQPLEGSLVYRPIGKWRD